MAKAKRSVTGTFGEGGGSRNDILVADDFPKNKAVEMTIERIEADEFTHEGEDIVNWFMYFEGKDKGVKCVPSCARKIAEVYGDDPDEWTGKPIVVQRSDDDFNGRYWFITSVPTEKVSADDDDLPF